MEIKLIKWDNPKIRGAFSDKNDGEIFKFQTPIKPGMKISGIYKEECVYLTVIEKKSEKLFICKITQIEKHTEKLNDLELNDLVEISKDEIEFIYT